MKQSLQLMRWLFGLCLNLFPTKYREEYGAELQMVFDLSLEDAAAKGSVEVAMLVLRELVSLPKAVLLEHLRERRKETMARIFDSFFDFASGSWQELLTALVPFFLVGAAMPLIGYLSSLGFIPPASILGNVILLALLGLFLILFIIGMTMGMPRWSLPYLGFLLSILSVYLFSAIFGTPIYFLFRDMRDSSLLMDILWDGIFWYGLLTVMIFLVVMARTSSKFQRFRSDWTLLSFILYGAVPFAVWFSFDEYVGDEPYRILAFLVQALGVWIYFRNTGEWRRFGTLFIAMSLAIIIAAVGKAILIPSQTWHTEINSSLMTSDVKHTLIMGGWFVLCMLISLGGRMLPISDVQFRESPLDG